MNYLYYQIQITADDFISFTINSCICIMVCPPVYVGGDNPRALACGISRYEGHPINRGNFLIM